MRRAKQKKIVNSPEVLHLFRYSQMTLFTWVFNHFLVCRTYREGKKHIKCPFIMSLFGFFKLVLGQKPRSLPHHEQCLANGMRQQDTLLLMVLL
jgi:hypothetical protein